MIRALVVDDEAPARSELLFLLGRHDDVRVRVDGPAWLVLGESFNRGWRASCDDRDLGAPQVVDGLGESREGIGRIKADLAAAVPGPPPAQPRRHAGASGPHQLLARGLIDRHAREPEPEARCE